MYFTVMAYDDAEMIKADTAAAAARAFFLSEDGRSAARCDVADPIEGDIRSFEIIAPDRPARDQWEIRDVTDEGEEDDAL